MGAVPSPAPGVAGAYGHETAKLASQQAMLRYLDDVSRSLRSHLDIARGCIRLQPSVTQQLSKLAEQEAIKLDGAINNFRLAVTSATGGSPLLLAQKYYASHAQQRAGDSDEVVRNGTSESIGAVSLTRSYHPKEEVLYNDTQLSEDMIDLDDIPGVMALKEGFQRKSSYASLVMSTSEEAQEETDSVSQLPIVRRLSSEGKAANIRLISSPSANVLNAAAASSDDILVWTEDPERMKSDGALPIAADIVLPPMGRPGGVPRQLLKKSSSLPRLEDSMKSTCAQSLRLELNRSDDQGDGRCVSGSVNPRSISKMIWDLFIILLVLVDSLILPFQFAYKGTDSEDAFDTSWLLITTSVFTIDLIINFFTAYEAGKKDTDVEPGSLVTNKRRIACNYMRSWFGIDLISTIPWGVLAGFASGSEGGSSSLATLTRAVKFLRFLRLMRMLRLAKLGAIWERIEMRLGSMALLQSMSLVRVMFGLMAICHWNACIWWIVGQEESILTELLPLQAQRDWRSIPHWTTVYRSGMGRSDLWTWAQLGQADAYIFCFYWTLGVMRTMPSEVTPVNKAERVYVMVFMFFAFSAFAISVAMITQTFFKISERKRIFSEEMAAVRMHLRRIKASELQQTKVKQYLRHLFDKRDLLAKEDNLLRRLPDDIMQRLKREKLVRLLPRISSLASCEKIALYHLSAIVQVKDALPGETLVFKGTCAEAAWILTLGNLRSVPHSDTAVEVVDDACLETVDEVMSRMTVSAVTCCELLRIPKAEFLELAKDDVVVRDAMASRNIQLYQQFLDMGLEVASHIPNNWKQNSLPSGSPSAFYRASSPCDTEPMSPGSPYAMRDSPGMNQMRGRDSKAAAGLAAVMATG